MLNLCFLKKKIICVFFSFLFLLLTSEANANTPVTLSNYVEAQTSMQLNDYQKLAGGVNKWYNMKKPTTIELQPTIRMNRDTLYSGAAVNVTKGATITLPDAGDRYMSLMVNNEFGYTNLVYYGKGTYTLTPQNVGSDYAFVVVRILVDPNDPQDVKLVNSLQDKLVIKANDNAMYKMPDWNMADYKSIHTLLNQLFIITPESFKMFGAKEDVDPVRFLIGTAGGFGGLPSEDATYITVLPEQEGDSFKMVLDEAPVDGFFSITVYNKDGYMFESEYGEPSINNITATPSEDGSYTFYFGNCEKYKENCLAIEDDWHFLARLYQPHEEVLTGEWQVPALELISE